MQGEQKKKFQAWWNKDQRDKICELKQILQKQELLLGKILNSNLPSSHPSKQKVIKRQTMQQDKRNDSIDTEISTNLSISSIQCPYANNHAIQEEMFEQQYLEFDEVEEEMKKKQKQYKKLMKTNFNLMRPSAIQKKGQSYLNEMLTVKLFNVIYEIDEVLFSKCGKSSIISSGQSDTHVEEFLNQEKEEKKLKEQDKLYFQIALLQQRLDQQMQS